MVTENGKLVGIVNRLDLYAAVVGIETEYAGTLTGDGGVISE
jgi:hypothetical protein